MEPSKYPAPLVRVTAGTGGEAILILGSEKTALHDCGMACFGEELVKNVEEALAGRPLDYVLLSHTHYDHIGALPSVLKRWPQARVYGNYKAKEVFARQGALDVIVSMGRTAAELYGRDPDEVTAEGMRVDVVGESGDVIDLGEEKILFIETKGHTDCSVSYFLQPAGVILASESTGIAGRDGVVRTSILKSFDQSIESAALLRVLPFKHLLIPHFGILPEAMNGEYFDVYVEAAEKERDLINGLIERGLSPEEIFEEHKKIYWTEDRKKNQPYRAYKMNTDIIIRRTFREAQEAREAREAEENKGAEEAK